MKTFSLELKDNMYADDTFNGTFGECVEKAKSYDIPAEDWRIAEVEIEDNVVTYTYGVTEGTEIE